LHGVAEFGEGVSILSLGGKEIGRFLSAVAAINPPSNEGEKANLGKVEIKEKFGYPPPPTSYESPAKATHCLHITYCCRLSQELLREGREWPREETEKIRRKREMAEW